MQNDPIAVVSAAPRATVSSNMYTVAIQELQDLESEPLCHRLAARLLVNNCHLLDGKDDATVLTDSGRAVRDFVDSYAASLAICDLERGSFEIPIECSPLREPALARLSVPRRPQLHVSPRQINDCLHGLSQSDAAWNTWISYRHKALRFCEAARAENEKDHNLRVYQRVAEVLSNLTTQIEEEMAARSEALDNAFQEATRNIDSMQPKIDHLRDKLVDLDSFMAENLHHTAKQYADAFAGGIEEAKALELYIAAMVHSIRNHQSDMAAAQENALQIVTQQIHTEAQSFTSEMAAAVISFAALQNDLDLSKQWAVETSERQEKIHANMQRLELMVDSLSLKYSAHEETLGKVQKKARDITTTLESAAKSASDFQGYISRSFGLAGWWPYIVCPAASLWMGSYGLTPSAARNLFLISLGEAVGFIIRKVEHISLPKAATATRGSPSSYNNTMLGDFSTIAWDPTS